MIGTHKFYNQLTLLQQEHVIALLNNKHINIALEEERKRLHYIQQPPWLQAQYDEDNQPWWGTNEKPPSIPYIVYEESGQLNIWAPDDGGASGQW